MKSKGFMYKTSGLLLFFPFWRGGDPGWCSLFPLCFLGGQGFFIFV